MILEGVLGQGGFAAFSGAGLWAAVAIGYALRGVELVSMLVTPSLTQVATFNCSFDFFVERVLDHAEVQRSQLNRLCILPEGQSKDDTMRAFSLLVDLKRSFDCDPTRRACEPLNFLNHDLLLLHVALRRLQLLPLLLTV